MLQMLRNVITVWYWYCILTHTVYGKQQYKTKTLTCWVCWSLAILLMRQCSLPCEEEGRYPWEEAWNPQSWLHQPAIQHHINWEQPSLLNRLKTWDCDDITSTLVGEREQANLVVQLTRLFTISIWVLHIPCNVLHNCVRFARTLPDTKVRHYCTRMDNKLVCITHIVNSCTKKRRPHTLWNSRETPFSWHQKVCHEWSLLFFPPASTTHFLFRNPLYTREEVTSPSIQHYNPACHEKHRVWSNSVNYVIMH